MQERRLLYQPLKEEDFVDLDLPSGMLWYKYNIGATSEYEGGEYYQWGAGSTPFNKNNSSSNSYYNASNVTSLPANKDTATVVLGSPWKTPNNEQVTELINNTDKTNLGKINGVSCYKYSSKSDPSKYIIIAGEGYYRKISSNKDNAYGTPTFYGGGNGGYIWINYSSGTDKTAWMTNGGSISSYNVYRYSGANVRPVKPMKGAKIINYQISRQGYYNSYNNIAYYMQYYLNSVKVTSSTSVRVKSKPDWVTNISAPNSSGQSSWIVIDNNSLVYPRSGTVKVKIGSYTVSYTINQDPYRCLYADTGVSILMGPTNNMKTSYSGIFENYGDVYFMGPTGSTKTLYLPSQAGNTTTWIISGASEVSTNVRFGINGSTSYTDTKQGYITVTDVNRDSIQIPLTITQVGSYDMLPVLFDDGNYYYYYNFPSKEEALPVAIIIPELNAGISVKTMSPSDPENGYCNARDHEYGRRVYEYYNDVENLNNDENYMDGYSNTQKILAAANLEDTSWQTASDLNYGSYKFAKTCWRFNPLQGTQGYWYLPSKGQLNVISNYANRITATFWELESIYGDTNVHFGGFEQIRGFIPSCYDNVGTLYMRDSNVIATTSRCSNWLTENEGCDSTHALLNMDVLDYYFN